MNNLISIIIVNYNGKKWLSRCLESLRCQSFQDFEIILVDNNSSDDSIDFVSKKFPQVKIVRSNKNLGFAGGNNLGISRAAGEYILMLNIDTYVENDFLEKLIFSYKKSELDVASVLEADYDSEELKIQNYYTKIDPFGYTISFLQNDEKSDTFNLCGFCLFFRKDFYEETQGLDENFFMYIEEIDWFWRLHLLGKRIGILENLHVHHYGSATVGKGINHFTFLCRNKNILQMLIKNYAWYNLIWVLPIYFLQNVVETIFFIFLLKPKIALSYLQGYFFVVVNMGKILKKRKWVQKNRKFSDFDIMRKYFYWGTAKINHLFSYYKKPAK